MSIRNWYSNAFARIYDPFMHRFETRIFAIKRHKLLHNLSGDILDVGSGTGANFGHFSKHARVTALEPNTKMMQYAKSKLPVTATIELVNGAIGDPNTQFPNQKFDFIVSTLVLCTIPNPELALEQFKKWLKPDGKLLLIEHIRSHNHATGKAQDLINPAWKLVADGCNLNRDTDKMVLNTGFKPVSVNHFNLGFRWFEGIYKIG